MKKYTLQSILFLFIFICVSLPTKSQKNKDRFDNLDKTKITTGILYDRPVGYAKLSNFSGNDNKKILKPKTWLTLYHEIRRASISKSNLKSFLEVKKSVSKDLRKDIISVGFLNYKINTFKKDAVKNGLVKIENNKYIALKGDIYDVKNIFAVSCIKTKKHTGRNNIVKFQFSEKYYFTNISDKLKYIKVDFSDGKGYKTIGKNELIEVKYNSEGKKVITVKAKSSDEYFYKT